MLSLSLQFTKFLVLYNYQQFLDPTKMAHSGYDRERFTNLTFDSFDCIICSEIVIDPMQCDYCGKLFCKICINDWLSKSPATKCPNRCKSQIKQVKNQALLRMYKSLDIKCSNPDCEKVVKLQDLVSHQSDCKKPNCFNKKNCENKANQSIVAKKPCCSPVCYTVLQLSENFGNEKKMYEILSEICGNQKQNVKVGGIGNSNSLCWDVSKFGTGVVFSQNNCHAFVKQQAYVFRSVIGNIGFTGGINYWEIIADNKTQNQIKIGIVNTKDFDMNTAFCDRQIGYAYYGIGQLRNGSNATGNRFGKKFKKTGTLGICLNMNQGTLSFALNGEVMGTAFTSDKLKTGTYYPAIGLLHCAGCTIRGGMPVPSYFR